MLRMLFYQRQIESCCSSIHFITVELLIVPQLLIEILVLTDTYDLIKFRQKNCDLPKVSKVNVGLQF